MAKWIKCKIKDIGSVVGGATPSTKKEENYLNGKIAWITPKDLSNFRGRYIGQGERNITETGMNSCSTQLLPVNTVLFSSRAPIGYVAIAANEVCTNQGFKELNGTIMITFSIHSVVSFCSPFTGSQMPQPPIILNNGFIHKFTVQ